jgi:hypothetical protein
MFQAEAEAALKKDRECIDGRPMFISKCDADKCTRQPGFKYNTTLEKNKLFVKGEMLNFLLWVLLLEYSLTCLKSFSLIPPPASTVVLH